MYTLGTLIYLRYLWSLRIISHTKVEFPRLHKYKQNERRIERESDSKGGGVTRYICK